jgi:shikimate kinase
VPFSVVKLLVRPQVGREIDPITGLRDMSILLVGYRGSGKSTIGRKLADRLWQTFVDTDEMIVKAAGKSIKAIFEQDGEPKFRDLETVVLQSALKLEEHVISLGGGAVVREANRNLIRESGHKVIYLRCEPTELWKRIQADPDTAANRPNLAGGGLDEIQKLLEERHPLYREVMTAELDVTNLTIDEAMVRVVKLA